MKLNEILTNELYNINSKENSWNQRIKLTQQLINLHNSIQENKKAELNLYLNKIKRYPNWDHSGWLKEHILNTTEYYITEIFFTSIEILKTNSINLNNLTNYVVYYNDINSLYDKNINEAINDLKPYKIVENITREVDSLIYTLYNNVSRTGFIKSVNSIIMFSALICKELNIDLDKFIEINIENKLSVNENY